jgi:hypothetical protein
MDIPAQDLPLAEKIKECQEQCGKTYGYRRVHIWLERKGIYHNPKTILRVMQKYGLLSVIRRKKYRNYGDYLHKYPNLLNRDFFAEKPKVFLNRVIRHSGPPKKKDGIIINAEKYTRHLASSLYLLSEIKSHIKSAG